VRSTTRSQRKTKERKTRRERASVQKKTPRNEKEPCGGKGQKEQEKNLVERQHKGANNFQKDQMGGARGNLS